MHQPPRENTPGVIAHYIVPKRLAMGRTSLMIIEAISKAFSAGIKEKQYQESKGDLLRK